MQEVRIENWVRVRLKGKTFLKGSFYGHPVIKDGTPGDTGEILDFNAEKGEARSAFTIYTLGKEAKR